MRYIGIPLPPPTPLAGPVSRNSRLSYLVDRACIIRAVVKVEVIFVFVCHCPHLFSYTFKPDLR